MTMRAAVADMRSKGKWSRVTPYLESRAFWWGIALAAFWLLAITIAPPQEPGQKSRIKDVTSIEGIRDNQLVGYGLVVGLKGTGDSSQTVFPAQTLVSALQQMGITVPQTGSNSASNMQVKNMAAVFAVATLPPFIRAGVQGGCDRFVGRRCTVDRRRNPFDDAALRGRWADLRAGTGSAGAGRLHGGLRRQRQAGESPDHGAHSRGRDGGAGGAVRLEADAHGERGA